MKNILYLLFILLLIACSDDDPGPVNLNFTTSASDAVESAGLQTITIQMSRAADQMILLDFTVDGNAALNGDYKMISSSPLDIPVGSNSFDIEIELIDESIIETVDKTLTFNLTMASTGVLSTTTGDLSHTFTIFDNDVIPNNGLQFDLTWELGTGVDIDLVDLDLVLVSNIILDSMGQIITDSLQFYSDFGDNVSGFETVLLNNNAPDGEYSPVIFYIDGTSSVNFTITLNSNSISGDLSDSFTAPVALGSGIIFPSVTKSGSSFSRVATGWPSGTTKYKIDAARINYSKTQ